jgi:hypothetical protein
LDYIGDILLVLILAEGILEKVVCILSPDQLLMWEHMILNCSDDSLRIHRPPNSKIGLEAREVCICWKDPNEFIKESLPLIKKERQKLALGYG